MRQGENNGFSTSYESRLGNYTAGQREMLLQERTEAGTIGKYKRK